MADEYNLRDFQTPGAAERVGPYPNMDFNPSLRVGMQAPDFDLVSLDGGRVRLIDEVSRHHVVVIFGAITSPVTATHLPELNRMWDYFHWRGVQFLFIYVRESHPGERYPHHTSMEQKIAAARELQQLEEIRFPVLVDSLDGATHLAYGSRPNPCFVVSREQRLVYRAPLVDPPTLQEYLNHLLLLDEVNAKGIAGPFYGRPMNTHFVYMEQLRFQLADGPLHEKVISRAGPKAVKEMEETLVDRDARQ